MPVLSRAELSRTGVIFVALLLAAVSMGMRATGAVAREFRAADTQTEEAIATAATSTGRASCWPAA